MVEKWAAWIEYGPPKQIKTALIPVKETAKQYKVDRTDLSDRAIPWQSIQYKFVVKKTDGILFDTELEALEQLKRVATMKAAVTKANANDSQDSLELVKSAISQCSE